MNATIDRSCDRVVGIEMSRYVEAGVFRLFDRRAHLVARIAKRVDRIVGRGDAAIRHDLDETRAALDFLTRRLAHAIDPVGEAAKRADPVGKRRAIVRSRPPWLGLFHQRRSFVNRAHAGRSLGGLIGARKTRPGPLRGRGGFWRPFVAWKPSVKNMFGPNSNNIYAMFVDRFTMPLLPLAALGVPLAIDCVEKNPELATHRKMALPLRLPRSDV